MLIQYLKSRARTALLIMLVIAASTSSMLLFEMPTVTVLYPLLLSLVIIAVAGTIDYCRFRCRHRLLESGALPDTKDIIEKDYQTIIEKLKEEELASRTQAACDYENMVEYYTVWVHQIKTPIASMRLNLQSEDSEFARKLSGDLNRIEAYVEMVLTFIRLDSNSTDYVIKEHDLDDIIKPAVRKFSREFILRKLSLDYKPTEYRVLSDEKWLSFIIEQIISNGVKYTSEGGIRIYMNNPGVLCIEDTGIGITPEDLPRIFENGYTGFNGREDKRASGIGLYLCKRIADNLGHGISAKSVPGEGTTIMLDLRTKPVDVE